MLTTPSLQALMQRNQQQDMPQMPASMASSAPQLKPAQGGIDMNDVHSISKFMGYAPHTVFGVPMDQINAGMGQNGTILNSIDPEAQQVLNMFKGTSGASQVAASGDGGAVADGAASGAADAGADGAAGDAAGDSAGDDAAGSMMGSL